MDLSADTPRVQRTCEGMSLSFPSPFMDGDELTLTPGLASTLNQVLTENLRNNFAAKAKAMKEGGATVEDVQVAFDKYAAEYEFGVRRVGLRAADPVEAAAIEIAEDIVKSKLRERGEKLKDVGTKKVRELAVELIERFPKIRERAKAQVDLRKDLVQEFGGV